MIRRHPVMTRAPSTKLRGLWVRNKRTNAIGYISYVTKPVSPDERPILHIVYPATPHNKKAVGLKIHAAGQAYADEVKRIKRPRERNIDHGVFKESLG